MRARNSKRLVIDTDVVRSAGGEDATDRRAINCRDFLKEVRTQNHRVVMTRKISDEWKRHRSQFALEWRVSMNASRRIEGIDPPEDQALQCKITTTTSDTDEIDAMQKDFHLLQAALATDHTVISLDETIRGLFARAAQHVGEIRHIIWVNPDKTEEEEPIRWLQDGAQAETPRRLSA